MKSLQYAQEHHINKVVLLLSANNHYGYSQFEDMQKAYGLSQVEFSVLKPPSKKCSQFKKAYTVYFKYDSEIKNYLSALKCTKKSAITVLDPSNSF